MEVSFLRIKLIQHEKYYNVNGQSAGRERFYVRSVLVLYELALLPEVFNEHACWIEITIAQQTEVLCPRKL